MKELYSSNRRILLAGATGLVGQEILKALLNDDSVSEIHIFNRRMINSELSKLHLHIVDFNLLPEAPAVDEVYLAIGTTIRIAGSKQAFRSVDFDANLAVAKQAIKAGATRIALVSAAGADVKSRMFYGRTKGELEIAIAQQNPNTLVIAQPSLLLGDRNSLDQPPRYGELIAVWVSAILAPFIPKKYQPVSARAVALALTKTLPRREGKITLSSYDIIQIGNSKNI